MLLSQSKEQGEAVCLEIGGLQEGGYQGHTNPHVYGV